jgi:hypothetical protein
VALGARPTRSKKLGERVYQRRRDHAHRDAIAQPLGPREQRLEVPRAQVHLEVAVCEHPECSVELPGQLDRQLGDVDAHLLEAPAQSRWR